MKSFKHGKTFLGLLGAGVLTIYMGKPEIPFGK